METIKSVLGYFFRERTLLIGISALMLAGFAEAATVHSCSGSGERCVVKVEEGMIGDRVRILDDKARPIAAGRIIQRRGSYAVVTVSDATQRIRRGYPVIVNIDSRSSSLQWAASFSN